VFAQRSITQLFVRNMYRVALSGSKRVFFQNRNDQDEFIGQGIVRAESTMLIPGSGVDLNHYAPLARTGGDTKIVFLFMGRLLREKGVLEFAEAAHRAKAEGLSARFQLLGFAGAANPSAITVCELETIAGRGAVEYLGETDDVRPFIAEADCVVLPSYYREGVPRSMLEAAAMERPIITTDMPGCRDTVLDGMSGYLVRPRNVEDLFRKMKSVMALSPEGRRDMGSLGRAHIARNFDERIVIDSYLEVIAKLTHQLPD
jgi:glycosyltransferase involved in cell wall biosynthesis